MNVVASSFSTQNAKFYGRRVELEGIHKTLNPQPSRNGQISCTVHGLGGLGKTQIAKQYFWEFRRDYTVTVWLHASEPATLAQDFSQIAARARGALIGTNIQKDIEIAREWLGSSMELSIYVVRSS